YLPADDANGIATVEVSICEIPREDIPGCLIWPDPDTHSFTITVVPVNDAPTFHVDEEDLELGVAEDAGLQTLEDWATDISSGPADESGQSLSFRLDASEEDLALFVTLTLGVGGTLSLETKENANGSAEITVTLVDDGGTANGGDDTSEAKTLLIDVTPVNDPPTAEGQSLVGQEDVPLTITLSALDPDGEELEFTILDAPSGGTLGALTRVSNESVEVVFTAPEAISTSFTYEVSDGDVSTGPLTVDLVIGATNDRPTLTINGMLITDQDASDPAYVDPIDVSTNTNLFYTIGDAEALDGNNDARAPYYFRVAMISIPPEPEPDPEAEPEPDPFDWHNFDINGF